MQPKDIVLVLVERYNTCQGQQYKVVRWPDEENRQSRDIDAYAETAEGRPPERVNEFGTLAVGI